MPANRRWTEKRVNTHSASGMCSYLIPRRRLVTKCSYWLCDVFVQRFFFDFLHTLLFGFSLYSYMLFELAIKVKVWLGVTTRYPVVALAQCYVYNRIARFNICIPYLTIYRIFYIFMRNSVKRASKEMNHVVNANEYFEIDSHEMSKTHLQLSHTHTLTRIHSHCWHEYCIRYCKLQL